MRATATSSSRWTTGSTAEPAKPEHVDAADWLRWEQRKHERLLHAVSPTPIPVTENA